jgi:transglutaminase superfamily protein
MMNKRLILALIGILFAVPFVEAAADKDTRERWFVVEMMDQRAGWMHSVERRQEDRIVSEDELRIEMSRGGVQIKLVLHTEFVETLDGEPISIGVEQSFGGEAKETRYEFVEDGVRETTTAGTRVTETMHPPIEGVWLTPREAEVYLAKRIEAGAEKVKIRTIDATSQLEPIMMSYTEFEPTTLELLGRTVKATRCVVVSSLTPDMSSVEYIDHRGSVLRSETDFGAMKIVMMAADRELALTEIDAPEMMTQLFIKPSRTIPGARTLDRATYLLTVPDGVLGDLPETGSQRVERVDERTVRVWVDARAFAEAPAEDVEAEVYLESSSMLDTTDDLLVELAERALDGVGPDALEQAEALRRFAYRHVKTKSLGIGFASASEVARSGEGDCTEHGTLLAGLLRVEGIPARVVSGLVYVDAFAGAKSVFGYHLWTQALLEVDGHNRWVDLDATLPGTLDYDATHIALGVSTLRDGEAVNGLLKIAPLLGRLEVTVESLD